MIRIEERAPTIDEYRSLRASVGWKVPDAEACSRALPSSVAAVTAWDGERPVGMARAIGDGALYAFVVDVVVRPDHQGQGVGRRLVDLLSTLVTAGSATGVVHLVADPDLVAFYQGLGWEATGSHVLARRG
jgi:GNAT superfamily N-acetyltransferase